MRTFAFTRPNLTPAAFAAALTTAALMTATLAPATAHAATARIDYADLDLSTEAGRAVLDQRVDKAAHTVCTADAITGSRIRVKPTSECLDAARADIRKRVEARTAARAAPGHATLAVRGD